MSDHNGGFDPFKNNAHPHSLGTETSFVQNREGESARGERFENANFTRATLNRATYRECDFENVSFRNATMRLTEMDFCNLRNVAFNNVNAQKATFSAVTVLGFSSGRSLFLENATLEAFSIIFSPRDETSQSHGDFTNIDCTSAVFHNVHFENLDLSGGRFRNVTFMGLCTFARCTMNNVTFEGAKIEKGSGDDGSLIRFHETHVNGYEIEDYTLNKAFLESDGIDAERISQADEGQRITKDPAPGAQVINPRKSPNQFSPRRTTKNQWEIVDETGEVMGSLEELLPFPPDPSDDNSS